MKKGFYEQFANKRAQLQAEVNESVITPVSFEVFKKTPTEREQLKIIKLNHKNYVKAYGWDPSKVMNVPLDAEGQPVRNR